MCKKLQILYIFSIGIMNNIFCSKNNEDKEFIYRNIDLIRRNIKDQNEKEKKLNFNEDIKDSQFILQNENSLKLNNDFNIKNEFMRKIKEKKNNNIKEEQEKKSNSYELKNNNLSEKQIKFNEIVKEKTKKIKKMKELNLIKKF